jgi:predicted enzyme related to lactoylglutathione lyase
MGSGALRHRDHVDDTVAQAALGGKLVMPVMQVPGVGRMAVIAAFGAVAALRRRG